MTALKVVLIILAVLLILLMCPLKVYVDYDGELKLKIGYLFLKFGIIPEKPKKPEKPKPEKKTEEKKEQQPEPRRPGRVRRLVNKHGIDGLIDILKEIAAIVVDTLKKASKHLYFTRFNIRICIVGEDAAQTAVQYGYVCSAVYPIVAVLTEHSVVKKHNVDISAGFLAKKTAAEMEITAKIKPLFLIPIAVSALIKLIFVIKDL